MAKYQLTNNPSIVRAGNTYIPVDKDNGDYRDYLQWIAEGNVPDPAEEVATEGVTLSERVEAVELMIDLLLDTQSGGA